MSIGVAVIGTSGIADAHVRHLCAIDGVTLEYVHSRRLDMAREFAERHGISRYTDNLEELLASPDVSGVVVVTEPRRHIDLAYKAMASGKHILIEKPLDTDIAKAQSFCADARDYRKVVSVVSPNRFDHALREMKTHLDRDALGLPKTVLLSVMRNRDEAYFDKGTGWRKQDSAVFFNQGIHWLDVMNWFFGEPEKVVATSRATRPYLSCADQTSALIDYPNDTTVALCGGTFSRVSMSERFTIHHSGGCIDYEDYRAPPSRTGRFDRLVRILPKRRANPPELMFLQIADFIDSIREGRNPITTAHNALAALKLSLEISRLD